MVCMMCVYVRERVRDGQSGVESGGCSSPPKCAPHGLVGGHVLLVLGPRPGSQLPHPHALRAPHPSTSPGEPRHARLLMHPLRLRDGDVQAGQGARSAAGVALPRCLGDCSRWLQGPAPRPVGASSQGRWAPHYHPHTACGACSIGAMQKVGCCLGIGRQTAQQGVARLLLVAGLDKSHG